MTHIIDFTFSLREQAVKSFILYVVFTVYLTMFNGLFMFISIPQSWVSGYCPIIGHQRCL